jgi:phage terminase large subunit-like protein
MTTTQSDEVPAGAFREELLMARKIRDGEYRSKDVRPMLPVLYEFPPDIAKDPAKWGDPANWPMVLPNLGRPMKIGDMISARATAKEKGFQAEREWASQFLNIEMGVGMKTDGWPGAEFWVRGEDERLSLEDILERSDTVIVGIDGGGLDDLFGLCVLGRERETRDWLAWSHAWCHNGVLDRRQTIAPRLLDFAAKGELTIVDDELDDVSQIVEIIDDIKRRGLLGTVSVDPAGLGEFIEALIAIGLTQEDGKIIGAPQGYGMMNAIKSAERKLANGTLRHAKSSLMDWCVTNVKIEPTATAIRATKQNAGDAKIDPAMALFDAVVGMMRAPDAPKHQMFFV